MKKIIGLLLLLFFSIGLIACQKNDEEKYDYFFKEGLGLIKTEYSAVYVDHDFNVVLSDDYRTGTDFYKGSAIVSSSSGTYMIDTNGNKISDSYDYLERYESFDIVIARNGLDTCSVLNLKGETLLSIVEHRFIRFDSGLIICSNRHGIGAFNLKGEIVIDFKYVYAGEFNNNVSYLRGNNLEHVIVNTNGDILLTINQIDANINKIRPLKEDRYLAYTSDNKLAYIDNNQNCVLPKSLHVVYPKDEYLVIDDLNDQTDKNYITNLDGKKIINDLYEMFSFYPDYFIASNNENNKSKIYNYHGNEIFKGDFTRIYATNDLNYIAGTKPNGDNWDFYYYNLDGKLIYIDENVNRMGNIYVDTVTNKTYIVFRNMFETEPYKTYLVHDRKATLIHQSHLKPTDIHSDMILYVGEFSEAKLFDVRGKEMMFTSFTFRNLKLTQEGLIILSGRETLILDVKNNNYYIYDSFGKRING